MLMIVFGAGCLLLSLLFHAASLLHLVCRFCTR